MLVDLSATEPDGEPLEFTFWHTGGGTPGKWAIVADPTAQNGRAVAQISNDHTDYRFPLAVYKPYSGTDLEMSVHFKPVGGAVDQAGGVAVRLSTPDDYYVARANALEDNVRFYRVVKGRREQLAGANLKVSANQWHTLALKAEGDRFTVSFDGNVLFSAQAVIDVIGVLIHIERQDRAAAGKRRRMVHGPLVGELAVAGRPGQQHPP
jgi:hypothetical protein